MEAKFESTSIKQNGLLSGKVLLLNQSYEPLTLCNVKKALILIFLDKAELVVDLKEKKIHSSARNYPYPSIIRLKNYVRIPYKNIILSRKNVIKRDGYRCGYCGKRNAELTIDHILPKSRGGKDTWDNLVTCCIKCNNKKGNQTPNEAEMPLLVKPYTPDHIMLIKTELGKLDEQWRPFLFDK
ncbi:MAG: HNH endonuclease [Melioribacteraceae bacterium]|nr:MAG: HNH endonuclease [Melioribacteraceae bacterium]